MPPIRSITLVMPSVERSRSICRASSARLSARAVRISSAMRLGGCSAVELEPLVTEQRHDVAVGEAPVLVAVMAQRPLVDEAGLLVRASGTPVLGPHLETDALQAQGREAEVDQRIHGIGAVSPAPLLLLADEDAELGAAVEPIHLEEQRLADRTLVLAQADDVGVLAVHLLVADPLLDLRQAQGKREAGQGGDVRVGSPAVVVLGVTLLEGAQEDTLALDDVPDHGDGGATRARRAARTCPRWRWPGR